MNPDVPYLDQHGTVSIGIGESRTHTVNVVHATVGSDHVKRVIENIESFQFGGLSGTGEPSFEERVKLPYLGFERRSFDHGKSTS